MKAGILGSGIVGRVLGAGFIKHGHSAMIGTRDLEKAELQQWVRETPGAKAGSFEEATRFGEMIVLVTLGRAVESAIDQAGPANFAGKTVIDATNPLADAPPSTVSCSTLPGLTNRWARGFRQNSPTRAWSRLSTVWVTRAWSIHSTRRAYRPCPFVGTVRMQRVRFLK